MEKGTIKKTDDKRQSFKNLYNHSEEDLEWLKKIVYESDYVPQLIFYVPALDNFIKEHKVKYPKDVYDAYSRLGNDGALIMSVILAMRESNSDLTMDIMNKHYSYLEKIFGPTK